MSLNRDFGRIHNWENICFQKNTSSLPTGEYEIVPELRGLIEATMALGINEITPLNYFRFYGCLRLYEMASKSFFCQQEINGALVSCIDLSTVEKFIGLHTNAKKISPEDFKKKIWDLLEREVAAGIRLEQEKKGASGAAA
tara:strand:- start:3290 stop:3712 length:423 start_codon:yes stop_codon:yes gene_type:complete